MITVPRADGYVTDVPYVRSFIRELTPAWLDHVALVAGFVPPDRKKPFAWCDLGCGFGVNANVLAATHSTGSFHGIDAMPIHVDFARRLASEAGISNVTFSSTDFETAAAAEYPGFDYIVSHGVYSWVDEPTRRSWRRFIDRHLKPGGLVYVSYNAMPGRAADLPYQRLVRAVGRSLKGNSQERVAAAMVVVNSMAGLKVPALASSPLAASVQVHGDRFHPSYLAHELMNANWEPLCVTDVRASLREIGLTPAGSATLVDNHDSFVLGRAAREVLAEIGDEDVRELARDYFIDQFFRRDVFIREGQRLSLEARRKRLMENVFYLAQKAEDVEYSLKTPAGKLGFDNVAARHIVHSLSSGPRRLAEIAEAAIPERDLVANVLVLSAAGAIWPVNDGYESVDTLNAVIAKRLGGPDEINCSVLPFDTALTVSRELPACVQSTVD